MNDKNFDPKLMEIVFTKMSIPGFEETMYQLTSFILPTWRTFKIEVLSKLTSQQIELLYKDQVMFFNYGGLLNLSHYLYKDCRIKVSHYEIGQHIESRYFNSIESYFTSYKKTVLDLLQAKQVFEKIKIK